MTMGAGQLRLLIFCLIFRIIFPIIGYAVTYLANIPTYGRDIDSSLLINKGTFTSSSKHNVTKDSNYTIFDLGIDNAYYRIKWFNDTVYSGNFTIDVLRHDAPFGATLWKENWWYNSNSSSYDSIYLNETQVINDFVPYNQQSHEDIRGGYWGWIFYLYIIPWQTWMGPATTSTIYDADVLFKDTNPARNDIVQAIIDGTVSVTVAKGFNMTTPNFFTFANWYLGALNPITAGETGLPIYFIYVLDIIFTLGIISAVLLLKEFIPFLP